MPANINHSIDIPAQLPQPILPEDKNLTRMQFLLKRTLCALHGLRWQVEAEITKLEELSKQINSQGTKHEQA